MRGNSRSRFRLALTLVAGIILATLPAGIASPALAAATASISGTVTVPAGVDVTKIRVSSTGPSYKSVYANSSGQYSLTGLEAGQYKVEFREDTEVPSVYGTYYGAVDYNLATPITVGEGAAIAGINQTLKTGGIITGSVTVPAGADPTKVYVNAYSDNGGSGYGAVKADGTFKVTALATGNYKVSFRYVNYAASPVVDAYYPGGGFDTATLVAVAEGKTTPGINQALKPAAIISGKISVPANSPAFSGYVMVMKGPDFSLNASAGSDYIGDVDSSGEYAIGGLEPGTYKINFRPFGGTWAQMWHGGVAGFSTSPTLTVTQGQQLGGLQDTAVAGGSISGSVAGGTNQYVTAVAADGTVVGGASTSNPATGYTVSNVFPGSYKVQFNRSSGVTTTQEAQYYKDLPESSGAGGATSVTVSAGQNAANIDATTRTGGTASGKVVGADGAPLENVPVRVYTKDGSLVTRAARTGVDGTFKVTGLSAGNYLVAANMLGGPLGPIFSGNTRVEANATTVAAALGQNADLGTLSYATASQGTPSFSDVPVGAQFSAEISWLAEKGISTGWTEANGSTTFRPLQPVNRDAMAAFMYRLAGKPAFAAPAVSPFADVPVGAQFYKEITWLAAQGISTGWVEADGSKTYRPLQPVNRDAMAAFMYRLAGKPTFTAPAVSPFADVPSGAQFYKEITWLAAQGISTGWTEADGSKTYRPLQAVNRDAMAAFMFRYNTKFGSI